MDLEHVGLRITCGFADLRRWRAIHIFCCQISTILCLWLTVRYGDGQFSVCHEVATASLTNVARVFLKYGADLDDYLYWY